MAELVANIAKVWSFDQLILILDGVGSFMFQGATSRRMPTTKLEHVGSVFTRIPLKHQDIGASAPTSSSCW
jgi:hypothetical protein